LIEELQARHQMIGIVE